MSMGRKTKERNAIRAMKDIGISEDKVKQVLKTLLKLYDKDWTLIEAENYRALADAIFDGDESEAQDHSEEKAQEAEEPERPLKRLKQGILDGEISSSNTPSTSTPTAPPGQPKEKPDEVSETQCTKLNDTRGMEESTLKNPERTMTTPLLVTSQSLDRSKEKQPSSSNSLVHENDDPNHPSSINRSQQNARLTNDPRIPSHPMRLRHRGTGAASIQSPSKNKKPVPNSSPHVIQLKESNVEPDTLSSPKNKKTGSHFVNKPKDVVGDMPCSEVPGNSQGGISLNRNSMVREDCTLEPTSLQSGSERNTAEESRNNKISRGECSSTLDIASSPSGEVKLSLSYKLAHGRPNFHMPNLEAVLKSVEDKCIRSPKTLNRNISMMVLMKETCECFLELGTDLKRQSVTINGTKSPATDVRGAKASSITLNTLVDSQTATKVPQQIKGMNGEQHLNKLNAEDEIVTNRENQGNYGNPNRICQINMSLHDVVDISRGQEKFVITIVNDVNDERPPSFCYIRQNATFQNAYANFSLARIGDNNCCAACSGDCLSLSVPCACSHESGGEFAYTADGLVREELLNECISMNRDPDKHCQYFCKECPLERSKCEDIIEPCRGHLVRNFVKECWIKCGCDIQCGNRVVQRGITRRLQVFMTPEGKGWGLRTLEDLPKGAFVCEYVGEVLTNSELFERVSRSTKGEKHSYPVLLDADWCAEGVLKDEEALCLDATYYGNVARFINHKCYDSNLVEIPVEVETPDHHYYHLAFFTSREVKAMEELTWDYGIDFDDRKHPIKAFRCQCGSKFCRNVKRSRHKARRR